MKAAILVFPGINRERDMARALKLISGHEPAMVWHADTSLPDGTDLVVVPGVAFSRIGGRLGNGEGYYDRLLERVRPDCPLVALCYESQLFDNLIVGPHDVFMDKVVTEKASYQGDGRSRVSRTVT